MKLLKKKHTNQLAMKFGALTLLILFFCCSFQVIPFFKAKEDRAKLHHFKAIKHSQAGKRKKAIKELKKAIFLDRKNEYLIDLANLYAKEGKLKKAYNTVRKVSAEDSSPPVSKAELLAWKGYYAISLGLQLEPFEAFNGAIDLMELYHVDSSELMSNLYNNSAVGRIFYQTPNSSKKPNVHLRDFEQAQRKLHKALEYNPDNCVAKYNLDFVTTILEVPRDSLPTVGNLDFSFYEWDTFPKLDCVIPPPPPHDEILTTLNKEKEVVFIMDISGSMGAPASNGISRFQAMKDLVLSLLDDLDEAVEVGLITLGQDCIAKPIYEVPVGTLSREELKNMVNGLRLNGGTPLNGRLKQAATLFTKQKREKAIFLCSDGINGCGRESTCKLGDVLRGKRIKVYAFSLLLENSQFYKEYAIYDCITKATYGELLGITETEETEIKTMNIREPVYPLALKVDDVVSGQYKGLIPQDSILAYKHANLASN